MLFRDMDDKFFDKFQSRDAFCDNTVLIMRSVVKSHVFAVISINAGSSDNGASKITGDIFYGNVRGTEVRFCPDIESIRVVLINFIFYS